MAATHKTEPIKGNSHDSAWIVKRTCLATGEIDYITCWWEATRTMTRIRSEERKTLTGAERIYSKHA